MSTEQAHAFALFQFTRPRGARLAAFVRLKSAAVVSIHAPARGATGNPARHCVHRPVSIHAPARGATRPSPPSPPSWRRVSIHAPARGATSRTDVLRAELQEFQFTRPRGARHEACVTTRNRSCFNSRAREGRDSGTFDAGISLLLQGGIRGARCK